jgi:NADH:ubiquinone oxidoreductase subunit E
MVDDHVWADVTDSGFFGAEGGDGADALDPAVIALVDELVAGAPAGREGLLPVLLGLQGAFDRVSWRVQELVADRFGLSPAQVAGIVSFYPELSPERRGRLKIGVCTGTGCWLAGSDELVGWAAQRLEADRAAVAEPRLAVERQSCLGICGLGPAALTGDRARPATSSSELDRLIEEELSGFHGGEGER